MTDNNTEWIRKSQRRLMIGLHVPDYDQVPEYRRAECVDGLPAILANIDPKNLVNELQKAHIQAFWFYSKCHFGNAYYPSKAGHVHSALNGRDLFGEFCEACLSADIVPLCVYEMSDHRIKLEHPEWCHQVPVENKNVDITDANQGTTLAGACLNGPYGDFVIEQALEIVKNYPVKGYYIDFLGLFNFHNWICPYCGEKFKKTFGYEFKGVEQMNHMEYVKYVKWFHQENDNYAKKIKKAIKDVRPDITFVHNFHGNSDQVGLQRADFTSDNSDFVTGDLFHLRGGSLALSWGIRQYANLTRNNLPGETLLDAIYSYNSDFSTTKAIDSYNAELWTARSTNVATCTGICMNIDGTVNPHHLALIKEIYKEHQGYEPWLSNMKNVANVGIVRSHNTLEFFPGKDTDSKVNYSKHALEFEGWVQVLIASHQLWDVVAEHQLTKEHLSQFKVLILPEVSCLSNEKARIIEDFVRSGGTLIAAGKTSLFDEDGKERNNFELASLGVNYAGAGSHLYSQLAIDSSLLKIKEEWVNDVICMQDGQLEVKAEEGCEILGKIFQKIDIWLINTMIPTSWPGIVRNNYGKGKCYYFAGTPGLHYRTFGQINIKKVMGRILEVEAEPFSPVVVDGSESVEVFAHKQQGCDNLIISLVNCFPGTSRSAGLPSFQAENAEARSPIRHEEIESMPVLAEVILKIKNNDKAVAGIYLLPKMKELPAKDVNNEVLVKVKGLKVHDMIMVKYK